MDILLKAVSAAGLCLTVVPAWFVFCESITWETHATLMLVGTVLWFGSAPLWMKKESD